jgi:hypothetical protein
MNAELNMAPTKNAAGAESEAVEGIGKGLGSKRATSRQSKERLP